jgi:DNA-binding response OmpR family regulator
VQILVIDDDKAIRETLRALFEGEGFDVRMAPDGESGLQEILKRDGPLVVLLDLGLPGMSGEETLLAALEYEHTLEEVAFIIITAKSSVTPKVKELTQQYGLAIALKPFDIYALLEEAERAGARVSKQGIN